MSIKVLSVVGLNAAIALDKEIVQIFKSDYTKTFFMLKEDYLADKANPDSTLSLIGINAVAKAFDNQAYSEFKRAQFVPYGTKKSPQGGRMLIVEYVERMYEGIQFAVKYEHVFPDFYNLSRSPHSESNKFQPEHFLVGTQVTVSPLIAQMYDNKLYPSVFTVQGIRANGPSSHCLITTTDDLSGIMPSGEKYSFNISHVESIVSQGKGAIKIQSLRSISYNEALEYERVERHYSQYAKKNHWLVYGGSTVVTCLAHNLHIPVGAVLDSSSLVNALLDQHFVKNVNAGPFIGHLHLINKKRAKKFVRQNLNRFLSSARKEQDRQDNEMDDYYFREMEKGFDEKFDATHEDASDDRDNRRHEVDESYFAADRFSFDN